MQEEKLALGLAEILAVDAAKVDQALANRAGQWDSVEVLAAIALLDEIYGAAPPAAQVAACRSLEEIAAAATRTAAQRSP